MTLFQIIGIIFLIVFILVFWKGFIGNAPRSDGEKFEPTKLEYEFFCDYVIDGYLFDHIYLVDASRAITISSGKFEPTMNPYQQKQRLIREWRVLAEKYDSQYSGEENWEEVENGTRVRMLASESEE